MSLLMLDDIMSRSVVTLGGERPVEEALSVMRSKNISSVVVAEEERPVGIFTEQDAVRLLSEGRGTEGARLSDVMTSAPLAGKPDLDIRLAYHLLAERRVRHMPVVSAEGRLVGIVSEGDFLRHLGVEALIEPKTVASVMSRSVVCLDVSASLAEAARLMADRHIGCVVVARGGKPVGIVTERDIVRLDGGNASAAMPLGEAMSEPLHTVLAGELLVEVVRRMDASRIRRLVVLHRDGGLAGIVTRSDLVKTLEGKYVDYLREVIDRQREQLDTTQEVLWQTQRHILCSNLLAQLDEAVFMADADSGRIVDINDYACQMLGFSRGELLGRDIHTLGCVADSREAWREFARQLQLQGRGVFDTSCRGKDGLPVPLTVSTRFLKDHGEDMVAVVARAVADRQQMEQVLIEQRERIRLLLDSTAEAIYSLDMVGRCTLVNRACVRMLGYGDESELLGQSMHRLIHHSHIDGSPYPESACLAHSVSHGSDMVHVDTEVFWRRDGSSFPVEYWAYPVFQGTDQIGVVVSFQDITARREAEEMLRNSNRRLGLFQRQTLLAYIEWDRDFRVQQWNPAAEQIFGFTRDEALGQTMVDLIVSQEVRPNVDEVIRALLEGREGVGSVNENITRDGRRIVCEWVNTPLLDADGKAFMVVSLARDVTERIRHEEELRRLNETLERRVREEVAQNREKDHILIHQSRLAAMGEMVHNIAHQWRQPLSALNILISNMQDDFQDGLLDADRMQEAVLSANHLVQQMSRTIDDFRDFFRPDAHRERFDVAQAVKDSASLVESSLKDNFITLELALEPGLVVDGFPSQFAQAVLNVISNAKEAIQQRKIPNGHIHISLYRHGQEVSVLVRDNGGGIPEDVRLRIFDPYFTTKESGSGIGLYMTKVIIERNMGGRVAVAVEDDATTLFLGLPLAAQEEGP